MHSTSPLSRQSDEAEVVQRLREFSVAGEMELNDPLRIGTVSFRKAARALYFQTVVKHPNEHGSALKIVRTMNKSIRDRLYPGVLRVLGFSYELSRRSKAVELPHLGGYEIADPLDNLGDGSIEPPIANHVSFRAKFFNNTFESQKS